MVRRFKQKVIERGWDLSTIKSFAEQLELEVKPYQEAGVAIPCFMKAGIFRNWFRTKSGAHSEESDEHSTSTNKEMIKIVELVMKAGNIDAFDPNKQTDLGTLMIGIFKQIIDAQNYGNHPDPNEQDKAQQCVMNIYEGYRVANETPTENFRVETMGLYLEILIGMQSFGPDLIPMIEEAQKKV